MVIQVKNLSILLKVKKKNPRNKLDKKSFKLEKKTRKENGVV